MEPIPHDTPRPALAGRALRACLPPLLLALAVTACSSSEGVAGGQAQDPQSFTLSGERFAIYNLAGDVEIRGHSGPNVLVEVTTGGPDADRLEIVVDRIGGQESLRVLYPDDRIHYSRLSGNSRVDLRVDADGTFRRSAWSLFSRSDRTRVSSSGGTLEAWADLRILVPASLEVDVYLGLGNARVRDAAATLGVHTASGRVEASGTRGGFSADVGSGRIEVSDAEGDLWLDTGSGSIDIRSVEGNVNLDTGSGSVTASQVRGGRLGIDTGSGSVNIDDLAVQRLAVDTGSGGIRIGGASARDIHLDTGSGNVALALASDVDHLEIDTGSGRVTLTVPANFGAELHIETGSGGIDTDIPIQVEGRQRRNELMGIAGDGRGTVRIDTGSGGVRIRPTS